MVGNDIVVEVDDVIGGVRKGEEDGGALPPSLSTTKLVGEFCGKGDGELVAHQRME